MPDGADNFYKSDKVTVQKVTFKNQYQMTVAGNLFLPKDRNRRTRSSRPIVVGHPMGAVKEQSADLYATKMAEQGFAAMSVDLSFWGESDGQPRNAVAPEVYSRDLQCRGRLPGHASRLSIESASVPSGSAAAGASSSARPRSTRASGPSRR